MHKNPAALQALTLSFCLLGSSPTLAHKLNMFAYVEGDQVFVEGYFADGKKAKNSEIAVLQNDGKVLVESKTNEEGQFSFPVKEKTDLKIVLNAGLGHQTDYLLTAAEITGETENGAPSGTEEEVAAATVTGGTTSALPPNQLKRIVHQAVAEAMKPLAKEIDELKNHTSVTQIVGGIGYIFGILGIVAYMQSRKK